MRALTAARSLAARAGARLGGAAARPAAPLVVVFSKDRAIQLELLLRSYLRQMSKPLPLTVLYRASTPAHQQAYEQVFAAYQSLPLTALAEGAFKPDLLRVLRSSPARNVLFLVDDIVFVQPVDAGMLEQWDTADGILSLRLGRNITHSFNRGGIAQAQPAGLHPANNLGHALARWRWVDGALDWSLPTSLDGHLLPLPDLVPVVANGRFKAPNSLEDAIGQYRFLFKWRPGYCWERSRIVNLPLNTVKTEDYEFPHQGWDAQELLQAFTQGYRLDVDELPLMEHNSCHMGWAPKLSRPGAERDAA